MNEVYYFITKQENKNAYLSILRVDIICENQSIHSKDISCKDSESSALLEAYAWINSDYPLSFPMPSLLPESKKSIDSKTSKLMDISTILLFGCFLSLVGAFVVSPMFLILLGLTLALRNLLLNIAYGQKKPLTFFPKIINTWWSSVWGELTCKEINIYQATNLPELFHNRCFWLKGKEEKFIKAFTEIKKNQNTENSLEELENTLKMVNEIKYKERFMNINSKYP